MGTVKEYTHELNQEIRSISGGYKLDREIRIPWGGRELLCALGNARLDSSCCGTWGCRYALVPGYLLEWKTKKESTGKDVSRVEPVVDERTKQEITAFLQGTEAVTQVRFW
jgi:hypothetical protein